MAFHPAPLIPSPLVLGRSCKEILLFIRICINARFFPWGCTVGFWLWDHHLHKYQTFRFSCLACKTCMSGSWLTSLNLNSYQECFLIYFLCSHLWQCWVRIHKGSHGLALHVEETHAQGHLSSGKLLSLKIVFVPLLRWPASILLMSDWNISTEEKNPQGSEPWNL